MRPRLSWWGAKGIVRGWLDDRAALKLMVTSSNQPAIQFYERLGFTMTGRVQPYPNDPGLSEYEMEKSLGTANGR
jgi:ribosomal protein S18 acetylase RimI-like enzyme